MPVTAKLSKLFYDRLGDDIANELVDWFNAVDATYRADLRELNELNFARFDAKLEQRVAELDAKVARGILEVQTALQETKAELIKWMFTFWAGSTVLLLGTMVALLKL
jgi:hypothetical protein